MSDDGAAGGATATPPALVSGKIVIAGGVAPFTGATAHVQLEDISYADAAAPVIAETVIPDVDHAPTAAGRDTVIAFALSAPSDAPPIESGNDYAVRVWIDRDSDGRPGPGDLHSAQSHRVLTRGFGCTAIITLGAREGKGERAR